MNSNQVVIYRERPDLQDAEPIFEWFTEQVPAFDPGQTLWLEIAVYPAWVNEFKPDPVKLTEFVITDVVHSLLRTYTEEVSTFYKVEVTARRVGDE